MPSPQELYRIGKGLANGLGRSDTEVPLPFQLTELENYVAAAQQELAEKEAAAEARAEAKANGPAAKRS